MNRIWLIPVAVAALAGAASIAQAAPASSALGVVKAAATEQAGKATQVHYRWYRYRPSSSSPASSSPPLVVTH